MALHADFDSKVDQRIHGLVAAGAAVLSYVHARTFFLPFMGPVGASVTPLLLDAVVYWLATASIRQARKEKPARMLRLGAYAVLGLSVLANALGGATWPERVFMALPPALFGYLTEVQIRLALAEAREKGGRERIALGLWLRHPIRALRAREWLARKDAPAFDLATAERDKLRAAHDAVRIALPGKPNARARGGVMRELSAGRLEPAAAVQASGLLDKPGVPELHRAALVAALGGSSDTVLPIGQADAIRAEIEAARGALRAEADATHTALDEQIRTGLWDLTVALDEMRDVLRAEIASALDRTSGAPASRTRSASGTRTRTRTPGAPGSHAGAHPGAVTEESAEVHFAAELAAGQVPSQRRIKAELHVGQDRATQIHAHLVTVTRSDGGSDVAEGRSDDEISENGEEQAA
jgi:hypothetical protein